MAVIVIYIYMQKAIVFAKRFIYTKIKNPILFMYDLFLKSQVLRALLSNKIEFCIIGKNQWFDRRKTVRKFTK